MRRKIVAGNWKMNTNVAEGVCLAKDVVAKLNEVPQDVDLIIAPPFTHLVSVADAIKGTKVGLSAQNCADEVKGAYTGEVSVAMLQSAGCKYTILGHSERRQYYGETSAKLVKKMHLALEAGISPIFCVGEMKEERLANKHFDVVEAQIKEVLFELSAEEVANVVIAYEPVWAIGSGKAATPADAQEVCHLIREKVAKLMSPEIARKIRILYGGSVNEKNAASFSFGDIDGVLVGGASLKVDAFAEIARSF